MEKTKTPIRHVSQGYKSELDSLRVNEGFTTDLKNRNSVSNCAAVHFHQHTGKRFKSTVTGQESDKVYFWRES